MKTLAKVLLIALIVMVYACHKNNVSTDPTVLAGKWTLSESYISIGGPGQWQPATDKSIYVQFNTNGTVEGTAFPGFTNYSLKDSVTLTFTKPDKTFQYYR